MTLKEMAAARKRSLNEIYYLAEMGRIPGAFKIGKQWRFAVPVDTARPR